MDRCGKFIPPGRNGEGKSSGKHVFVYLPYLFKVTCVYFCKCKLMYFVLCVNTFSAYFGQYPLVKEILNFLNIRYTVHVQ